MYTIVHNILELLFPPSEEARIVRGLTSEYMRECFSFTDVHGMVALSRFHDARIRALIHEAKFHGNERAFQLLGVLVLQYVEEKKPCIDVVIPIPLSRARLRARGYNQVEAMLRSCGSALPFPIVTDVLSRARDTRPQTELSRRERLMNVRDAFRIAHPEKIRGAHILLVDDVMTTGATLRAAKAALLPHAASVTLVALAH